MFPEIARDDIFQLETERLWLRWPRPSDAEALARCANDPDVAAATARIPHPYELRHAEEFIRDARRENEAGTALNLAITLKSDRATPVGIVSVRDEGERRSLTAGFWLARDQWGRGFMSEAMLALIDLAFKLTSVEQIVSTAAPENARSLRIHEKLGFEAAGAVSIPAPARKEGVLTVIRAVLKRGKAHTAFGARRPKLVSS